VTYTRISTGCVEDSRPRSHRIIDATQCTLLAACFHTAFCDRLTTLCRRDLLGPAAVYGYSRQAAQVMQDLLSIANTPPESITTWGSLVHYHLRMAQVLQTTAQILAVLQSPGRVRIALEWMATAPHRALG